ncbi:hypothetical protein [Rubellimicrobium roseum]|uniref:hypothetical protein n=1 Tax=Rubellimicrobium roseum TaxID=687525 RepID=UPI001C3F2747
MMLGASIQGRPHRCISKGMTPQSLAMSDCDQAHLIEAGQDKVLLLAYGVDLRAEARPRVLWPT